MLLDIGFHLSTLSSSCYDQNCLYQCHLLQIPQILFLTRPLLSLSNAVSPNRSIVLTTLCWYSLLSLSGGVTLGSSSIGSGGVTVVLFRGRDLCKDDCLTCNGITDMKCSTTPILVFLGKAISWLD